jgi:hypothetical protein
MRLTVRPIAKIAANKYIRKVEALSAWDALQRPTAPIVARSNTAMPCNIIPGRRGGRKINTSLTRGIIVEISFSGL